MDLSQQIAETEAAIKPLAEKLERLRREKRRVDSNAFIAANKITRAQVTMSAAEGVPWFGTIWGFTKWLTTQPFKPWAEWNGRLYRTNDLINELAAETPGLVEHLPD